MRGDRKRNTNILFSILFVVLCVATSIQAQENGTNLESLQEIYADSSLEKGAGITPDSAFYFLDEFFDAFADDLHVREEKIAEMLAMLKKGKEEEARQAFDSYAVYAADLEESIEPERLEEAKKSSAAIWNALEEVQEENKQLKEEIKKLEESLLTSAELAVTIKDLCEQLSRLDPKEYEKTCKITEDDPEWKKELHEELTDEQRKEAEELYDILGMCFKTSGKECDCDKISIVSFAEECKIAAPLATACEAGDEEACEKLDDRADPEELLPEYLHDVLARLEQEFGGGEDHLPEECEQEGITDEKECDILLFNIYAPTECKDALEKGDIKFTSMEDTHEQCGEYLSKLDMPYECIEAGITEPEDCGSLLFKLEAPKECIEAGLTGEHEDDNEKCNKLLEELYENKDHEFEDKYYEEYYPGYKEEAYKITKEICEQECASRGAYADIQEDGFCVCYFEDGFKEDGYYGENSKEEYEEEFYEDEGEEYEGYTEEHEDETSKDENQAEENDQEDASSEESGESEDNT